MTDPEQAEGALVDVERRLLPACAELFVETFNAEPWNDRWTATTATARLEEMVLAPGFVGVALVVDGRVTGAALGQLETWYSGRHLCLREMFVRADQQRRGRGSRLLAALAARCPDVENIYLMTGRGGSAQRFYERHGFGEASSLVVMTRGR